MTQDRPSLEDVLLTVQALLDETVPKLQGENRYHVQVGSYLLGIAAREVRLSGAYGAREADEISGVLGRAPGGDLAELRTALSSAIRAGELDGRWDEVAGLVLGQIIRKAAIVRPDHLDAADRKALQA